MAIPKVFSLFHESNYVNIFPKIRMLGRSYNIFLQCYSYDVIIPVTEQQEHLLNIFEETVLKMLNYKACSSSEIAETLCMNKDLINFIIIRLRELGLIDDKYSLSERGKSLLNEYKKNTKEIKYIPGRVFINKDTNEILPYIHVGEFICEDVIECSYGYIKVANGNTGNSRTYTGKYLRKKCDFRPIQPKQVELRKLLRSYNMICLKNTRYRPVNMNSEYAIDISQSEDIVFHFQAIIQDGNVGNIIVSDGFVMNIDCLSKILHESYPEIVDQIKREAIGQAIDEGDTQKIYSTNLKYPELQTLFRERNIDRENQDEKKEAFEKYKARLTDCFSAIEWSLHYYLMENPLSNDVLTVLKNQTMNENRATVVEMLKKIGASGIDDNRNLISNLEKGKITIYFQKSIPSLYTLLPLVIIEAAGNGESSVHNIVSKMPDFMTFINVMNKKSGCLRHDAYAGNEVENFDFLYEKTLRFVTLLIPDFKNTNISGETYKKVGASQQRLKAEISLSDEFGSVFFSTLDNKIQNELLKISLDKHVNELPLPYEYVLILSRVLETYLYNIIKYINVNKKSGKQESLSRVSERWGTNIPKTISGVGDKYYFKATIGGKATLGAYAIVILSNTEDVVIDKLKETDFVNIVNEICELRKHGNSVGLCMDAKKMIELRGKTVSIIKVLGGYYG